MPGIYGKKAVFAVYFYAENKLDTLVHKISLLVDKIWLSAMGEGLLDIAKVYLLLEKRR
jgi:hypothetical protein